MNLFDRIDDFVLYSLHDTTTKNLLLILLAFYCLVFVKNIPNHLLEYTNNIVFRVAVIVSIIYIGRKHIDLGIMMGLAFYFTIRQASRLQMDKELENNTLPKREHEEKPRTDKEPTKVSFEDKPIVEHGMRIPFHQSKYVEDLTQPAHQLQNNEHFVQQENFKDEQSYDQQRQNPETCPMMRNKDESCIQGLTKIQGNVPKGYTDLNNLASF